MKAWVRWAAVIAAVFLLGACSVKKTQRVETPTGYVQAKTATRQQLVELVNDLYSDVNSLTVGSFRVQLTGGSIEDGLLEKYRDARGYLVAQRSSRIFVNIQNPLTNSSVLTMAARNQEFQIWIPSRNQYVTGRTDVEPDEENPIYNVRPSHILEAILVDPLPLNDSRYVLHHFEDQDAQVKYYVLEQVDLATAQLVRRIWVERSQLRMRRQQYYREGKLLSDIVYSDPVELNGRLISCGVSLTRPIERYSLRLQLQADRVEIDKNIQGDAFEIVRPPGAEVVRVDDRLTSGN